jgi:hypothetical protein
MLLENVIISSIRVGILLLFSLPYIISLLNHLLGTIIAFNAHLTHCKPEHTNVVPHLCVDSAGCKLCYCNVRYRNKRTLPKRDCTPTKIRKPTAHGRHRTGRSRDGRDTALPHTVTCPTRRQSKPRRGLGSNDGKPICAGTYRKGLCSVHYKIDGATSRFARPFLCSALEIFAKSVMLGISVIIQDPETQGSICIKQTPVGMKRTPIEQFPQMFGEADVKTLQWLTWLQSEHGHATLGCRSGVRIPVCLTSVDTDMLLITAMHTMLARCGTSEPCKVFIMPGGIKKRKVEPLFYDVDVFCDWMASPQRDPCARLATFLNKAWAALLPGCDFVRGFPRLEPAEAMRHAVVLQPIVVEQKQNKMLVSFRPESAARVVGRSYSKLNFNVPESANPDAFIVALRAKYKRCAANERDETSASAMLRAAFWTLCGYWLNAAHGNVHEAILKLDASSAAVWGFEIDREKVFHATTTAATVPSPRMQLSFV